MRKTGLVFAGGGGKGAYQIGVWKALKEFGIENSIQVISGTSIGALNAALFIQGDYDIAEDVWIKISQDKVLSINPERVMANIAKLGLAHDSVYRWLVDMKSYGFFTRDGLLEIIDENLNLDDISNSNIVSYATCFEKLKRKVKYFNLNGIEKEKMTDILLASSALPLIFDSVKIDGTEYTDGGFRFLAQKADNVPVQPVYDEGCNLIIVVHLDRNYVLDANKFSDAQLVEIIPQEYQGGCISGTLNFTVEGAKRRIDQGYKDALHILKPIFDMVVTQAKVNSSLQQIKNDENQFELKRKVILQERDELKSEIDELLNRSGR